MTSSAAQPRVVVLAAGAGSLLHPLTASRPKPMVEVAGKPILGWCLEALREAGVREVTLVVGHKEVAIQSAVGDGRAFGLRVTYVHQGQPIGTAHAVASALREGGVPDAALVLGGDNVFDAHLVRDLLAAGPDALAVAKSTTPARYGVVTVEAGFVREIREKPPVQGDALVSTGAVLLSRPTLDLVVELVEGGVADLPDALDALLRDGLRLRAMVTSGEWLDAVDPFDLVPLAEILLARPGVVGVSPEAVVDPTATVEGAVHVAAGASVGARAVVTGPASLAANARVGPGAIVARALVMEDAKIGPGAIVEGSVVAQGVTVGAGAVLGAGTVPPEAPGQAAAVRGVVVGEGSTIGPGAVVAPGSVLGVGVTVAPGVVVRGRVPDRAWVV